MLIFFFFSELVRAVFREAQAGFLIGQAVFRGAECVQNLFFSQSVPDHGPFCSNIIDFQCFSKFRESQRLSACTGNVPRNNKAKCVPI